MQRNSIPVWSDHAYQSMQFQTITQQGALQASLTVGSWNLQDKCHSKESNHGHYANNPYNVDEGFPQYQFRKRCQMGLIQKNIGNGLDDIVFLQEIDFLKDHKGSRQSLRAEFESMLRRYGYVLDVTQKPKADENGQQPLAIIYNAHRLVLESSKGVFPIAEKAGKLPQYRGYEATFRFRYYPEQKVIATNLHLIFGHDYREEIEAYQINQEKTGHLCIMGGDTNNVQHVNLSTSIGNWNCATNFSRNEETQKLTIEHEKKGDGTQIMKSYDRFFGVPSRGCYLKAMPTFRSQHIVINDKNEAIFAFVNAKQCQVVCSRIGERWRPPESIINELVSMYQQQSSREAKKNVLDELRAFIQFQGLSIDSIQDLTIRAAYDRYARPFFHQHAHSTYYEHYIPDYYSGYVPSVRAEASEKLPEVTPPSRNSRILEEFFKYIVSCQTIEQLKHVTKSIERSPHYKMLVEPRTQSHLLFNTTYDHAKNAYHLLCQHKEQQLQKQIVILVPLVRHFF